MEITIKLTQEQANQLLQLIDIAIKAGGYQNDQGRRSSGRHHPHRCTTQD